MGDFLAGPQPGRDLPVNRDYAQWVLEDVGGVEPHPDLAGPAADLTREASELLTAADGAVSVGIFGEYNTGKSLMLGTLVGNPLLLPVNSEPATANVTRLRLAQGATGDPASITAARVEYFQASDLPGYIASFSRQAAREARKYGHTAAADEIAELADEPRALPRLVAALTQLGTPGDSLTALAAEVRALDTALLADPPLGTVADLDPADPWRLVAYGGTPGAVAGQDPDAYRSLVRQVVLDVSVPAWAWNLRALRGATLHLVDIPGVGAQSFRDSYVGQQELAKVTAALAAVNAIRASAATAWEYVDRMAQRVGANELTRRLMIAATRFDTLDGVPGNLLDNEGRTRLTRQPSEEEFLGLKETVSVGALVAQTRSRASDRFAFVSPLVAIGKADPAGPVRWDKERVIELLPSSRDDVKAAVQKSADWTRVGAPAGPVGDALRDFGADGGMDRLRDMLTRYVLADGLAAHADDVAARAQALAERHARFREQVTASELTLSPEYQERQRRRDAQDALRRHADRLVRAAAQELRDPRSAPADGVPSVRELLERQCWNLVWSWPEWQLLFGALRGNLVVVPRTALSGEVSALSGEVSAQPAHVRPGDTAASVSTAGTPSDMSWLDDYDPDNPPVVQPVAPPPVMAGDLLEPFLASCSELREQLAQIVAKHVDTWFRERARPVAEQRKILDDWLIPLAQSNPAVRGFYPPIRLMTDLDRAMTYLRRRMDEAVAGEVGSVPSDAFPLDPMRALPWHPDSPRRTRVDLAGPAQVQLIRRMLVAALVRVGSGFVKLLLDAAATGVERAAGQARDQLANRNVWAAIEESDGGSR